MLLYERQRVPKGTTTRELLRYFICGTNDRLVPKGTTTLSMVGYLIYSTSESECTKERPPESHCVTLSAVQTSGFYDKGR
jgi:hypothetical protein